MYSYNVQLEERKEIGKSEEGELESNSNLKVTNYLPPSLNREKEVKRGVKNELDEKNLREMQPKKKLITFKYHFYCERLFFSLSLGSGSEM